MVKTHFHFSSWAGLTPQCNESAGKKKSVHVSRAGIYLKPLLIQCANNFTPGTVKIKLISFWNGWVNGKIACSIWLMQSIILPYFKLRYDAIKKRRGHKRAIIAIARMLLTCIYQMLSKNETFNFEIYEQLSQKNFYHYLYV